jgi:hypothetical protein
MTVEWTVWESSNPQHPEGRSPPAGRTDALCPSFAPGTQWTRPLQKLSPIDHLVMKSERLICAFEMRDERADVDICHLEYTRLCWRSPGTRTRVVPRIPFPSRSIQASQRRRKSELLG